MRLLLDTNVFVYNFVDHKQVPHEDEDRWKSLHSKAKIIFDYILDGKHTLVIPAAVKVEIAGVVMSITKSEESYSRVMEGLKAPEGRRIVEFPPVDNPIGDKAIELISRYRLSVMDSIIAASCMIRACTLLTNDKKLHESIEGEATNDKEIFAESIYLTKTAEEDLHKFLGPGLQENLDP